VGELLTVLEPATEGVLEQIPAAGVDEVDQAVVRAKAALPAWRAIAPGERAQRLYALADAIEHDSESLAVLEARNAGKPLGDARGEMGMVAETFRYYAAAPERLLGDTIPVAGGQAWTVREPLGVVGLIVPWNFPLTIAAWKLGPALAAGNTVVLKPAELTPLTALKLEQLAAPILGEGVLNVVAGLGPVAGARLVEHPDVAKIAFTGSTRVGREIASKAAATLKRVTLELGGKSANIVFADADLERAAAAAPMAVFANAGQDCCARSRILVQRSVVDRFLTLLEEHVRAIRVGDPLADGTEMGPLISAAQRERVRSFMGDDEAPVAFTGSAPKGPGFWFPPTVLYPVEPSSRAVTEEIFGPVTAVIPFDDEAEAVRLANATIYGLSGSIWTENGARALRVARAVETGVLSINSNSSVRVSTPFGGFKQSGYGRELGPHALDAYTEVKTIYYATA
jgi:acyl-CoA reductase-like NAD-dependent aldehyde dehydrogenase